MAILTDIPPEITCAIAERLPLDGLRSLRQSCRQMNETTFHIFVFKYFKIHHFVPETQSLENIESLSKHPIIAPAISVLEFCTERPESFATPPASEQDSESDQGLEEEDELEDEEGLENEEELESEDELENESENEGELENEDELKNEDGKDNEQDNEQDDKKGNEQENAHELGIDHEHELKNEDEQEPEQEPKQGNEQNHGLESKHESQNKNEHEHEHGNKQVDEQENVQDNDQVKVQAKVQDDDQVKVQDDDKVNDQNNEHESEIERSDQGDNTNADPDTDADSDADSDSNAKCTKRKMILRLTEAIRALSNCKTLSVSDFCLPKNTIRRNNLGNAMRNSPKVHYLTYMFDVMMRSAAASNVAFQEINICTDRLGPRGYPPIGPEALGLFYEAKKGNWVIPTVTSVRLVLSPFNSSYSHGDGVVSFLKCFPQLKRFSLAFDALLEWDMSYPLLAYPLHMARLQVLELCGIDANLAELTNLLLRHKSTLQEITLECVRISAARDWVSLLQTVQAMDHVTRMTLNSCLLGDKTMSEVSDDIPDIFTMTDKEDFEKWKLGSGVRVSNLKIKTRLKGHLSLYTQVSFGSWPIAIVKEPGRSLYAGKWK